MPPYSIRQATRKDVPQLVRLWREMMDFHLERDPRFRFAPGADREIERHITDTIRSRAARIYVADHDSQAIGYILGEVHARRPIYPAGTYGFISDMSVLPAWRRQGVGRALAQALLDWFRSESVTSVELFAAERNPVSVAFWRALGFADYLRLLRRELQEDER